MRSRRIAAWTAGFVVAVATVGGTATASVTEAPSPNGPAAGAYVTCSTPPETSGDVTISAARAERGTTATNAAPDETCVVTE